MNKKKRCLRTRNSDDSDDEEESNDGGDITAKLEEMRSVQKLRQRKNGVSLNSLNSEQKVLILEDQSLGDPFKTVTGGLVNMQVLKNEKYIDKGSVTGLVTQFSAETNKREEDEQMVKYIEEEMARRKCQQKLQMERGKKETENSAYISPEEAALKAIPQHLKASTSKKSEEMLSSSMLNGIPEIDLGIEAKIRNIEATEEAKMKLYRDQLNNEATPSPFVPTNMAVNFVQHNRFSFEEDFYGKKKKYSSPVKPDESLSSSLANRKKLKQIVHKSNDDYCFERFKKQFKRL